MVESTKATESVPDMGHHFSSSSVTNFPAQHRQKRTMGGIDEGNVEFHVVSSSTKAFQTMATNRELCTKVGGDGDVSEGLLWMLVPMSDISEWECRSPFAEKETGVLMESQWVTREGVKMDGEPIPLKSLPSC